MRKTRPALVAATACLFAVSACSTTEPESAGGGGSGDVETGTGVTDSAINIGVLTDLSGPFAAGAAVQVTEFQAYWDQVNADGGICERDVEMQVQDHAYDPQKAVSLFRSMSADIVALQQVLGGPTSAAVLPLADQESLYVGGVGWASTALEYEVNQLPGASYSVQGANAIDYLVDELDIAEGDSVGVIYFVGDYGNDALAGAEHAAEERGLEVIPQEITPATSDLSAQASSLVQDGASAVILAAAPGQLASLAGVLGSQGADIPIIGMNPTFNPALLNTPAAESLLANTYSITSVAPYSADTPGVQAANELYTEADPDGAVGWEVPLAYGQAQLLRTALEGACEAGDLTPEGVVAAMREDDSVDTEGLFPDGLDFSTVGESPTRTVYVSKVSDTADAGLELIDTYEGPSAQSYTFG